MLLAQRFVQADDYDPGRKEGEGCARYEVLNADNEHAGEPGT